MDRLEAGGETSQREVNLSGRRRRAEPLPYSLMRMRPRALTAAAESGNTGGGKRGLKRLHQDWQPRALGIYHTVGEAWYPGQFYARSLSKTRYFPALLNERGEPEEQTTGPLMDLFDRIHDPGSPGRSELAASYGRLQFLTGDGYLVVSEDDDNEEAWEYLSVLELRVDPKSKPTDPQRYRRYRAPGGQPEEFTEAPDEAFTRLAGSEVRVSRLWRKDPGHSDLADAPVRPLLDLYELLHWLTLAAASEAYSRAAQRGLLLIARELVESVVAPGDPQEDPESHPFMRVLAEALETGIQNPGTASAASPLVLVGPAAVQGPDGKPVTLKDMASWIQLGPSDRYAEGEMWEKTIERIGNGLDLPRQVLTGEARNHWGDWAVDEQGYRQHVAPVTERFCADLASAYLRPAARDSDFPNWERVAVGYDPADAITHPDKVGAAQDAHDRIVVSDKYLRDQIGATDQDAPDEEERDRRILILLNKVPPGIDAGSPDGETAPQDGGRGGDVVEAPPAPPDAAASNGASPNGQQAAVTASALQTAKIIGAAEAYIDRARERAGARLRQRSKSCPDCQEKIRMVPQPLVAAAMGQEMVHEVINGHTTELALVEGISAQFANKIRTWGVTGDWPKQLGELVEQHALLTLYDEVPAAFPHSFSAAVTRALR